jgi:hypothetical protein
MPLTALRRRLATDRGFTLIELVIYCSLLAVVMLVVAGITISALRAQSIVRSMGAASNGAQLVMRSVGAGIRNSSSFQAAAPTASGQLLRARVAAGNGGLSWTCTAWYYSSSNGSLYMTTNPLAMVAAPVGVPAGWSLLATGVSLPSGVTQPFTASGTQLKLALKVAASGGAPVLISTTFAEYPQSDLTTSPVQCF